MEEQKRSLTEIPYLTEKVFASVSCTTNMTAYTISSVFTTTTVKFPHQGLWWPQAEFGIDESFTFFSEEQQMPPTHITYLQPPLFSRSIIHRCRYDSPATINIGHIASVERRCSTQGHLKENSLTWKQKYRPRNQNQCLNPTGKGNVHEVHISV